MQAPSIVRGLFTKVTSAWAFLRREPEFVCADCSQWARCGLASSDHCVIRAAELARGDWKMRRRAKALRFVMGWPMPSID
jgi:hypothetical protein